MFMTGFSPISVFYCLLLVVLFTSFSNAALAASSLRKDESSSMQVRRVDVLERIFPDIEPITAEFYEPIHVPRGGHVPLLFVVSTSATRVCELSVGTISNVNQKELAGDIRTFRVQYIPVEGNSQGCSVTRPYPEKPRDEWMPFFIREAPFEIAEILIETDRLEIEAATHQAILVDIDVSVDALPGMYEGDLELKIGRQTQSMPFIFQVHSTVVTDYALQVTNWLFPEPETLTNGEPPEWWSDEHWNMIENSGRTLLEYGQKVILTQHIEGEHPLVQTRIAPDGSYEFDLSRFERWVELFISLGFEKLEGAHLTSRTGVYSKNIFATDDVTNEKRQIFKRQSPPENKEAWFDYLSQFLEALYTELESNGWLSIYVQHIADEPYNDEEVIANYGMFAEMVRTHLPGVSTMDAIWDDPTAYFPYMDAPVMAIFALERHQSIVSARKQKGLSTWMYNFCKPYPPQINRWFDLPISNSRMYPLFAYKYDADGYLFWAANVYRGADPYTSSIGPVPNGSQNPGHPPGDNWLFYPGPDGLIGSMRMVAFRDGLLDHALMIALAEKDREKADEIMNGLARSLSDHETDPVAFHEARKEMLTALDNSASRNNSD